MSEDRKQRIDLVGVAGSYTDREGNEKQRFVKCGSAWVVVKDGEVVWGAVTMDAIPVVTPDHNGTPKHHFRLFKPDDGTRPAPRVRARDGVGMGDDDIPF